MDKSVLRKPPALLRWTVLLVISLAMMGNYYIYDSISPVADLLISQLGFSQSDVTLLNAIYSMPNIFMVFIGGILIDRFGTKKSSLLFTSLIVIGAFLTCLTGNLIVMASGRLIFGLGAESMIIAVTTVVARWFKGKQLAFAFGLNLTIARLGSWLAQNSPSWASKAYLQGWQKPLYIAAFAGIIAIICIVVFYLLDYISERKYNLEKEGSQDKIDIKHLFNFPKSIWYISLLCLVFYSAMFPFISTIGNVFFQHVHHVSRSDAGFLVSIPVLAAMIFTPLFGLMSDYIGNRSRLMLIGSSLIIPIYLLLAYGFDFVSFFGMPGHIHVKFSLLDINSFISPNQFIPMVLLGLSFSLVPAIMWPSVALIVESNRLGTAYGLMTMIQNIGLVGFNLMIGLANDKFNAGIANPSGYIPGMWIFSICGVLGILFAILLKRSANTNGAVNLDKPMKEIL
jgi:MFS family permease